MVVLMRRPHEKVLIPAINASLHVAAIEPGVVRVAVEAPPEVAVLRGELYSQAAQAAAEGAQPEDNERVRKRLTDISRALGLARLELSAGLTRDAGTVLRRLHREVQQLRRELGGRKRRVKRMAGEPDGGFSRAGTVAPAPPGSTPRSPRHA